MIRVCQQNVNDSHNGQCKLTVTMQACMALHAINVNDIHIDDCMLNKSTVSSGSGDTDSRLVLSETLSDSIQLGIWLPTSSNKQGYDYDEATTSTTTS